MTVDFILPPTNGALICEKSPTFFPIRIPSQHHQLKNYISTKLDGYLYYASGYGIYALHLSSRKRRLVKTLKWKPTCLDAAHGWIGAGGHSKGQCAFIRIINSDAGSSGQPSTHHSDIDGLLPLDLDPESRALLRQDSPVPSGSRPSIQTFTLHEYQLGDDIVNSVVIQRLPAAGPDEEDDIVAVLTNNDKTVRIFSLTRSKPLPSPTTYPVHMNHATLSPDGTLLLAVGDTRQAFFSRRKVSYGPNGKLISYRWQRLCQPVLSLTHKDDCCFTTAWSSSGHICAVASQTGIVTIYSTAQLSLLLKQDEATIGTLKSSRLNATSYRGAVRSMSFSPGPWDLLAFGEDLGRATVVDLRNALQSTQVLSLDTKSSRLSRVEVQEQDSIREQRQSDRERRFLELQGDPRTEALILRDQLSSVAAGADNMDLVTERRRMERESELNALRNDPHRLSDSERRTIDAIGLRRATRLGNSDSPISVSYTASGSARIIPPVILDDASTGSGLGRHTASMAEYMRLRNSDRPQRTSSSSSRQPQRRNSVVLQNANRIQPSSSTLAPLVGGSGSLSASPSQLPALLDTEASSGSSSSINNLDEPWHTISAAMGWNSDVLSRMRRIDTSASGSSQDAVQQHLQSLETDSILREQQVNRLQELAVRNEQRRQAELLDAQRLSIARRAQIDPIRQVAQVAADSDDEDGEGMITSDLLGQPDSEDEVVTMGVTWSPDGRFLYVGTEEGVFEYKVNQQNRKLFPSYEFV